MATEIPLKMMKNEFCFILKALFVLKILDFYLDFLVMQKIGLIRKITLISKFQKIKKSVFMQVLEKTRSLFMRFACVILEIAKVIAPNSFFNRVYLLLCFR